MKILLNKLIITALLCCVAGCSKHMQIERDLSAYQDRLETFTKIDVDNSQVIDTSLRMPSKAELDIPIAEISIKLREFYAFNDCHLSTLIAQRNTALGKMQLPSNRFSYEKSLIAEFDECAKLLSINAPDSQSLLANLQMYKQQKQEQLPFVWSNFITQSSEIYLHLSTAKGFISGLPDDNFQSTKQALRYVISSLKHPNVDSAALEEHLQTLEYTRLLARMWRTQLLLKQFLDKNSLILEQYVIKNTCKTTQQAQDIAIMRNIFTLFFAEKIQALAAELNKYHYQLNPLLTSVVQDTNLPTAFKEYIHQHININHANYAQSMQRHIKLWQQIFAVCE